MLLLQPVGELFGDGGDLARGAAGSDHHEVAHLGAAAKVDRDDVLGLVVLEGVGDDLEEILAGHLGVGPGPGSCGGRRVSVG